MNKEGIRFLGIDDSHFNRGEKFSYLIGCIMRKNDLIEGFLIEKISIDGLDSTEKIIKMIENKRFNQQIRAVFLAGITFGGFNIANIEEIYQKTKKPIIVLMKNIPDLERMKAAIKKYFDDWEERIKILEAAGEIRKIEEFYVQSKGVEEEDIKRFLKISRKFSKIPEVLRIAHMIGSAISLGYSTKKVL